MKYNCKNCDKEFNRNPDQLKRFKNPCCTIKCSGEYKRKLFIEKLLKGELSGVKGKKSTADYIKFYILNRDNHECVECFQKEIHNGKKLTLELDHIDGNYLNNNPNNLRTLCPNCHTQTKTYGAKNMGKSTRSWN